MALLDGLNIPYVEDEPDTREVIAFGLERHGAHVCATDSAPAALLMFETQRTDVVAPQGGRGSSPRSFRRIRSSANAAVARSRSLPTSPTPSRSAGSWTISVSAHRRSHLLSSERSSVCRWTTRGGRSGPAQPDTQSQP